MTKCDFLIASEIWHFLLVILHWRYANIQCWQYPQSSNIPRHYLQYGIIFSQNSDLHCVLKMAIILQHPQEKIAPLNFTHYRMLEMTNFMPTFLAYRTVPSMPQCLLCVFLLCGVPRLVPTFSSGNMRDHIKESVHYIRTCTVAALATTWYARSFLRPVSPLCESLEVILQLKWLVDMDRHKSMSNIV